MHRFACQLARAACAASAVIACLGQAGPAAAGKKDDMLVFATDRENSIVDSSYLNSRESVILGTLVYDRLIHLDANYQPSPLLATKWTWVNETTLDLDIRQGVRFHSGKEMDAADVAYTLNFIIDKASSSFNYAYLSWIKSADVVESHKVRIAMNKAFPTALIYLAGSANIMPKGHYDQAPLKPDGKRDFGAVAANGTGPYRVVEIKPGDSVLMEKNTAYWDGSPKDKPQIGRIKFRTIKDSNTRLAEIMTGAIDWVWDVPKDQAERLVAAPGLTVENAKTLRFSYIAFDVNGVSGQKYFTDKRVRQAVAHAINRPSLVKNLVGEPSEVVHTPCHPDQFGCTSDVPKYDYNPEKAKKLLAEAGHPNGFEFDLHAYREREYTEAIIGDLTRVGLKPRLQVMQYSAYNQAITKGQVTAANGTWGSSSIPDISAATGYFFTGTSEDMTKDAETMRRIAEADGTIDPDKRKALWREIQVRIAEEAFWVPLFTYAKFYVYSKDLNFKATSDEIPQFYRARWK